MNNDTLPLDGAMSSASPPHCFEEGGGGDGGVGLSRLNPNTNAGSHTRRISNDVFYSIKIN